MQTRNFLFLVVLVGLPGSFAAAQANSFPTGLQPDTAPSTPLAMMAGYPQIFGPPHPKDEQTPPNPAPPAPQQTPYPAYAPYGTPDEFVKPRHLGSTYIPLDSWVYPAMTRLYSMGYLSTMFLGMRPWTRQTALNMLLDSQDEIVGGDNTEAQDELASLLVYLQAEQPGGNPDRNTVYGLESTYDRVLGIAGTPLRDSYHLGQTIANDYGRPYESGFNDITGFSTVNEMGRFSLYLRGEYQHAPSAPGYSFSMANTLSQQDLVGYYAPPNAPQDTIPAGRISPTDPTKLLPLPAKNPFRLVEANLSFHLLGHEISGGKSDAWLGPAQGGAMAWSNNAEDIYSFRVNRVDPLHIPLLSRVLGPMRYDFFYGSLKGHTAPNHPWTHSEMFSFRPTENFEFAFQRTIIFGGAGHEPVTLHTFLKGFFSTTDTTAGLKFSRDDPGARFSDFTFSWRLPFVRRYSTLYLDSISHDDVSPVSAPRRASFRTGMYFSQIPKLHKLDFRVEAVTTDPPVDRSNGGQFAYFEIVQVQGYTNKGNIMGDWIGREAKGGQAWLTYHLSGNEMVQLEYLNKKTPKDFVNFGTTQNEFKVQVIKRLAPDVELNSWLQYERWKAPFYKQGQQNDTTLAFQVTWFPKLHNTDQGVNFDQMFR